MIDERGRTTLVSELTEFAGKHNWRAPQVDSSGIWFWVAGAVICFLLANLVSEAAVLGCICIAGVLYCLLSKSNAKEIGAKIAKINDMRYMADQICSGDPENAEIRGEHYENEPEVLVGAAQIAMDQMLSNHPVSVDEAIRNFQYIYRIIDFLRMFKVSPIMLKELEGLQAVIDNAYHQRNSLKFMMKSYGVFHPSFARFCSTTRLPETNQILQEMREHLRHWKMADATKMDYQRLLFAIYNLAFEKPHNASDFNEAMGLYFGSNIAPPTSRGRDDRPINAVLPRIIVANQFGPEVLKARESEALRWMTDNYDVDFCSALCALKMRDLEKACLEKCALSASGLPPELQRRLASLQKTIDPNATWLGKSVRYDGKVYPVDVRSLKWRERDVASVFGQLRDEGGTALSYGLVLRETVEPVALMAEYKPLLSKLHLNHTEFCQAMVKGYSAAGSSCSKRELMIHGRGNPQKVAGHLLRAPLNDGAGTLLGTLLRIAPDAQGYRLVQYALCIFTDGNSGSGRADAQERTALRFVGAGDPTSEALVTEMLRAQRKTAVLYIQNKLNELYFGASPKPGPKPQGKDDPSPQGKDYY